MRPWLWGVLAVGLTAPHLPAEPPAKPAADKDGPSYQIPYRLTETKHVLVRVKINGKGPFNFILDTGAPAIFMHSKVAEKVGLKVDTKGWVSIAQLDIEGGLREENVKARVEDLFQLEGMNGMGLAGVELHGVLGYNLLSRYRIEYDFTQDKLGWTALKYDPEPVAALGKGQGGLEALGQIMKLLGAFMGKDDRPPRPRGFLGVEVADRDGVVEVVSVLPSSPAAEAGLKKGDLLVGWKDNDVENTTDLLRAASRQPAGATIKLKVRRDGKDLPVELKLGRGL